MKRKTTLILSMALMSFGMLFTSCNDDDDDDNQGASLANVMLVNASPGSVGYDLYVDDQLQNSNGITYGTNSAYYQSVTGMRNLKVNKTQSAMNVIDIDETLNLDGNYSLFALDTVGSVQSVYTADDLTEPVLGKAHIRFVHGSHNSGALDIVNLADTSVVFSNISFRQFTAFTPVDAGSYSLGYRLLGDTNIASLPTPVNLGNRQIYTVVASGFNTDTSGTAVTSLDIQLINNN